MADLVAELFDEAYRANEDLEEIYKKRHAIRGTLRHLRDAGQLNDEQEAELEEMFPTVHRKRKNKSDNDDVENDQ